MNSTKFDPKPLAPSESVIGGNDLPYRITVLTDGLVSLEYNADSCFEDRPSTLAVNRNLPTPSFRVLGSTDLPGDDVSSEEADLEIITDRFHLRYDKRPFSPNGLTLQVKGGVTDWHSVWRFGVPETEFNYLGGTARTLDNANGRISVETGVISKSGYALIDDSHTMLFDGDWFAARRQALSHSKRYDLYIFAYAHDYMAAVKAFYQLSGPQPLLPRWAFGNWWSRYKIYSEATYKDVVNQFKAMDIPLSVGIMDMDWHWTAADEKVRDAQCSGWSGYSWNTDLFPDPPAFAKWLHDRGIKTALCDHPADGIARYEDVYKEACKAAGMDPSKGDPVPFNPVSRKLMDIYFKIAPGNLERTTSPDFWWVDWQQGPFSKIPGIDPLWVLIHLHYFHNAHQYDGITRRPMTFARYAGPGSHRYPIGFSGDTHVTWDSLTFQPEFTAMSSNVGYGYWSHDIGGHMMGYRDVELLVRWVQLGVYSPILRIHSSNNPFNNKEPWMLNEPHRKAVQKALQMRHRIIPYLYSHSHVSAEGGLPLVRPLYWLHPNREEAYRHKGSFMLGDHILCAPIVSPGSKASQRARTTLWLPPGRYVDLSNFLVFDGDREMAIHRELSRSPAFVREGGIVVGDASSVPDNDARNPTSVEVCVIVGADGQFELIEDNDTGTSADNTDRLVTKITWEQIPGRLTIHHRGGAREAEPQHRDWKICFPTLGADTFYAKKLGWKVELSHDQAIFEARSVPSYETLVLVLKSSPQLAANNVKQQIYELANEAQVPFAAKDVLWNAVSGANDSLPPLNTALARLQAASVDADVKGAAVELLTADAGSWSG